MTPSPRLTSAIRAGAIRRFAEEDGGSAAVVAKGDETSGNILIELLERGDFRGLFERIHVDLKRSEWTRLGTTSEDLREYCGRRRRTDPDLWLMEVNVPDAAQFIARLASVA